MVPTRLSSRKDDVRCLITQPIWGQQWPRICTTRGWELVIDLGWNDTYKKEHRDISMTSDMQ